MSNKDEQKTSPQNRTLKRTYETNITNSRKNRTFIDRVLESNDEHAIKKLFEEYFYLHAEKHNHDRITWDEFRFIVNELLQRNNEELTLIEATALFYKMYQLRYHLTMAPIPLSTTVGIGKTRPQRTRSKAKSKKKANSK